MSGDPARPCRYCVADWAEVTGRFGRPAIRPEPADCEMTHRDDPRIYALAEAMAKVFQAPHPTDAQVSYFLGDADDVVDDFIPPPTQWHVRKLPHSPNDGSDHIEARFRVNGVTYVFLDGGKDCRGSCLRLSEYRAQLREANTAASA